MYVTLVECRACGVHWTEEHKWEESWEADKCGRCGADGYTVRQREKKGEGTYEVLYSESGIALTWNETTGVMRCI